MMTRKMTIKKTIKPLTPKRKVSPRKPDTSTIKRESTITRNTIIMILILQVIHQVIVILIEKSIIIRMRRKLRKRNKLQVLFLPQLLHQSQLSLQFKNQLRLKLLPLQKSKLSKLKYQKLQPSLLHLQLNLDIKKKSHLQHKLNQLLKFKFKLFKSQNQSPIKNQSITKKLP